MTFGEKLLELRKQNNFSQEELAEKLGVSRQAVSRWESGETMPDSPNLLQISNIFSVSADYLLRDEIEEIFSKQEPKTEKTESKKKNPLFIIYVFGLLGMAALLYIIALSDLDIVYWVAGTIFLLAGIISAVLYYKNPRIETKSPLYLAASIIFFAAAVVGFCSIGNVGFIMGVGNFVISVILFIIWAKQ
ncbi:MAG: helix-turn-helix transcriptional regulator [Oscillospiraceae bacterium]|nr:helix-turn-helix transcriptional regulator [Oscillospiraceae bacterium]